jgi:hypothetical protein
MNLAIQADMEALREQIKTTRNLAEIALVLIEENRCELLPTALETMFEQAQSILDNYCVVGVKE